MLAACGVAAVLVSAAALILMFLEVDLLPPIALKAGLFAGAVAGIVLGTLALAWYLGVPRFTGVGVLVCSVVLLVAGLVLEPKPAADVGPAPPTPSLSNDLDGPEPVPLDVDDPVAPAVPTASDDLVVPAVSVDPAAEPVETLSADALIE